MDCLLQTLSCRGSQDPDLRQGSQSVNIKVIVKSVIMVMLSQPLLESRAGPRSRSGRCHSPPACQYRARYTSEYGQRRMSSRASLGHPRQQD